MKELTQFEKYFEALIRQCEVNHEGEESAPKADDEPGDAFHKGYAYGKLLGRLTKDMDEREKVEFHLGMQDGIEIEQMRKEHVH